LFDKDGTSKVCDNEREGERETVPAPVTGYVTPLAFAILVLLGAVELIRSLESYVMWSVAPESIIHPS
jgi:hypothetical protein